MHFVQGTDIERYLQRNTNLFIGLNCKNVSSTVTDSL